MLSASRRQPHLLHVSAVDHRQIWSMDKSWPCVTLSGFYFYHHCATPITVCYDGHPTYAVRCWSIWRPFAGAGDHSIQTRSGPTCWRLPYATFSPRVTWLIHITLRLDHHWAEGPTGSFVVCDLPTTPVILVVRRRKSRCEAEGPASKESRSPCANNIWLLAHDNNNNREGPLALSVRRAERRAYFNLLQWKQRTYWTERVVADQSHQCRLWRSFNELLGRDRPRPPNIDATAIHQYRDDKVIGVCTANSSSDPPSFTLCPTCCTLPDFHPVTPADVEALVRSLPNKQCSSYPQPNWLLKANANILSPFLCQLFNSCLEHGTVPSSFKSGYVTPLLKKADLDAADVKSYRPITNLFVVYKLLERLVHWLDG